MKISDLTLLTVSFNNNIITGLMIKSFFKQLHNETNVVIVDNGTYKPVDERMKSVFEVVDNFQHKLLPNYNQCSKNHCSAVDYVLKNLIKTKWVLLVDNDVFFKPAIKDLLLNFDESFDCMGEVGWDDAPPTRLFPYFCLINVEKMKNEKINYFDETRIIEDPPIGKQIGPRGPNTHCWYHDTGSSFYEDIKDIWKIKEIKLNDFIVHNKTTGMPKMTIQDFIKNNLALYE